MTPGPASYLDQSSGDNLRTQLEALNNSYYANMVASGNTAAWDGDQLALQSQINVLAEQLGVDLDPQVITGGDQFDHLKLEEIRDLVAQIKPDVVHAASEAWSSIGSGMAEGADTARTAVVDKAIAGGWDGTAGQKAAQTFGKLFDSVADIGKSASMVAMKIAFAQRGSDEAYRMLTPLLQSTVGAPTVPNQPGTAVPDIPIPLPGAQQADDGQKEEARQAALQVLRNVYSPGIRGGDQAVPVLPTVYPAANPGGPVGPEGPGPVSPGPGPSNSGGGDQKPTPGDSKPGSDPNSGNDSQSPGTQPDATNPASAQNPASTPGTGGPNAASTTAAGFDPSSNPGGGTSGSGMGGGSHGSGSGAGGGLSGSGGGTSRPGPGSAVPGGLGGQPMAASPGRNPGQPGTPGMQGMSPGMGGKGGGKSEEDKERQSADYLRGQHLEEWIEDGRKAMPAYGAIGENPPQAEQPTPRPPAAQPPNPRDRGRPSGEYR